MNKRIRMAPISLIGLCAITAVFSASIAQAQTTIGFDEEEITLEEGASTNVRLSIAPAPSGASTVAVALSVSDDGQLTVSPERVVFSATNASFDVVVDITEDAVPEPERTFAINLTPPENVPTTVSTMSVIVPIDNDTPTVRVIVERTVILEGATASVFIDAVLNRELIISMAVSGLTGAQTEDVSLSTSSLTLSPNNPSASFDISVADNREPQAANGTFKVDLSTEFTPEPDLPSLTFTIPPNDLTAHASTRAEFTLENEESSQTMTINITPPLRGDKGFIVSSEDSRLIVKADLITPDQSSFSIELALSELLDKEDLLSLIIIHLDSWQPFTQPSAQAQLDAGTDHNCAIKADGTVACWGEDVSGSTDPTNSLQGVDVNTRFLAVSVGDFHTCSIREGGTVACWGRSSADPARADVNVNTRFLAVSAGGMHNCGIKADSTVVCWGSNDDGKSDPTSSHQDVDADTRFLAVSAGSGHTCGIKADSTMACWGDNDDLQSSSTSVSGVEANTRFLAVSAGDFHTCAIKADSTMACWGWNGSNRATPASAAGVDANTRFLAVSAGISHTCAIKADSTVACWGDNTNNRASPTESQQDVDANTRFLAVSAGGSHTCGIKADSTVACWGDNHSNRATPPSDSFSRTPDVFRLAEQTTPLLTQDGEKPVRLNEVTGVELLHPIIMLNEGETTTLTLFKTLNIPTDPPITIEIGESDEQILSVTPRQFTVSEEGETATATFTSRPNDDFLKVDPIKLSVKGAVRLTPTDTITVNIENDEFYTISLDRQTITLEEGESTNVRLSITPTPSGANEVTVTWEISDTRQITVEPEEAVFSMASTSLSVAIAATDDDVAELGKTFTARPTPLAGIDVKVNVVSVTVPTDNDTPTVRIMAERAVIPEGTEALVFIDATLNRDLSLSMAASGLTGAQTQVSFSPPSLTLSPDNPSTSFLVSVADNGEPQAANRTFNVALSSESATRPDLPSLALTVPPNDLTAYAAMRAEFTLAEPEPTLAISTTPTLQSSKSFLVSSGDPRIIIGTAIITPAQSPFSVELALSEDAVLGEEELLSLNISPLDIWQPFAQPSAQAQISAGSSHTCGIKADGAAACWGSNNGNRANPMSSPHGVDANTRFLAISAGTRHTCAIKADNTVACWGPGKRNFVEGDGLNLIDEANPASAAGVDANTRFLAVSAGFRHSCGIKANGTVICWGNNAGNQANPASAAGVDANTRFLAISAGNDYTCGIKADSAVACWGSNSGNRASPMSSPHGVDANTRFLAVSSGGLHSCGIKADGTMACWGDNEFKQSDPTKSPHGVDANTRFLAVSGIADYSCAIKADGTVACWGVGEDNQTNLMSSPQGVSVNTRFLAVSAGDSHACAIKADSTVACWGNDVNTGKTNPPPDNFSRTPDVLRLAEQTQTTVLTTQDGGEAARLNAVHTIGFERDMITLEEGASANVRLSISPASANTVTVLLSSSDEERLAVASSVTFAANAISANTNVSATDNADKEREQERAILLTVPDDIPAYIRADTLRVTVRPDGRDSSIVVTVEPTSLSLEEGAAERITFAVPDRFIITGPTTIRLTAEGDISVASTQVILDEGKRAMSVLVTAMQIDGFTAGMKPRPATISLSVASGTEDPRLMPEGPIRILIEKRRTTIMVIVDPISLRLVEGATERITFTVPERSSVTGPTYVGLKTEGDITVTPTQVILDEGKRAASALVTATQGDGAAIGMEPRPATISLTATSDTEDPRLFPGDAISILIEKRRTPITIVVDPIDLRLATGATERITFMVQDPFIITGPTTILLTIDGDITVTPAQVILDEMKSTASALVTAIQGDADGMEPRSATATISLTATSDTEDPQLVPSDIISILIGEDLGIRVKVRVYLEGALP